MERVLVTGVNGLIGRHVAAALAQSGLDVHGCSRTMAAFAAGTMHTCDLLDIRASALLLQNLKPDILVHCAWVTTHGVFWQSPENLDWLGASLALLRSARNAGTRRFVGVGTCAEYSPSDDKARSEIGSDIAPSTLYGAAKDAMHRVAEQFARVENMECAWARVFMLFGAGEHRERFVASLARALVAEQPARMSSGRVVRDFLDARDVGTAIAAIAVSSLTGPVNVGSGEGVTLRTVGEKLATLAGRPDLLVPGAIPDRPHEPKSLVAGITRLRDELGFRPSITLERGLGDVLEYWRAN